MKYLLFVRRSTIRAIVPSSMKIVSYLSKQLIPALPSFVLVRCDPFKRGYAFLPNASLEITEIREILSPYEKTSSIRAPTKVLARSRFAYVRNDQKYMYIYIIYNISFLI